MTEEFRHWATDIAKQAIEKYGNQQIVSAGWSPSGQYHIGNSREAVTCYAIHKSLKNQGANSEFVFVIDDFDPLDKIPQDLKEYSRELKPYLGHPISRIPDFTKTKASYAEYFAHGAIKAMNDFGFETTFVRASELYSQGNYDKFLSIYLDKQDQIDQLFEGISGSPLSEYLSVICQECGNMKTPREIRIDGDQIHYECISEKQYRGCGNQGSVSIASHEWKLKWRLDWPARQTFLGVTVEPSGKDHSVAGGSVDTAIAIHREVLNQDPPMLERYGFITLKGKKFSGSKGGALPAAEVNNVLQPSAYLYLIYRSDLLKDVDFNPQSSEYGKLLDEFDDARRMLMGVDFPGRESEVAKLSVAADFAMHDEERGFLPCDAGFDELALLYQISLRDIDLTIAKLKDLEKIQSQQAEEELRRRLPRVRNWLDNFAPSNMLITFQEKPSEDIASFWSPDLKDLWINALDNISDSDDPDDLNTFLRDKSGDISPKEYYQAFYQLVLGKSSGPNAANLVFALGIDRVKDLVSSIQL